MLSHVARFFFFLFSFWRQKLYLLSIRLITKRGLLKEKGQYKSGLAQGRLILE